MTNPTSPPPAALVESVASALAESRLWKGAYVQCNSIETESLRRDATAAIEAMNIPALLTEERTKALEEAAKVADEFASMDFGRAGETIADNIRSLKAEGGEK